MINYTTNDSHGHSMYGGCVTSKKCNKSIPNGSYGFPWNIHNDYKNKYSNLNSNIVNIKNVSSNTKNQLRHMKNSVAFWCGTNIISLPNSKILHDFAILSSIFPPTTKFIFPINENQDCYCPMYISMLRAHIYRYSERQNSNAQKYIWDHKVSQKVWTSKIYDKDVWIIELTRPSSLNL